ncbi:hypothetical protein ACFLTH_13565, partial [Bacteroidota bacterium]
TVSDFEARLDIDLKKFFDLADTIINDLVVQNNFFERLTVDLIAVNGFDGSIPPISGKTSLDFQAVPSWIKSDVSDELKILLADDIPNVQVLGAKDSVSFQSDDYYFNTRYKNFISQVNYPLDQLQTVSVDFLYLPWWEPYLSIEPGMGEIIMENPARFFMLIPFMLTKNEFYYDLSYPVVVSLEDTQTLNGDGFSLKFAFEVNIRGNEPFDYDDFVLEIGDDEETAQFLFNNPLHWNSGEITIRTLNPADNSSVEDVILTFTCGQEELYLGTSSLNNEENEAYIKTKLPVCVDGRISGFKHGYFVTNSFLTTDLNEEAEVIVYAEEKKTFNLSLKKRMVGREVTSDGGIPSASWAYIPDSNRDIGYDERVMIVFTRVAGLGEEEFVSQVVYYGNESDIPTVEFVSGQYVVEAFLFKSGIVIPPKEYCDGGFLGTGIDEDCYESPEINFNDSFYGGGLLLDADYFYNNETTGYFNVTFEDKEEDEVTVHLLAFDSVYFTEPEDLEIIDKQDRFIIPNREQFYPIFGEE